MKLREFLQIEKWSKRTSRKMFVAFGVVTLGFVILYGLNARWTSPKERRAAREALAQLDTLKSFTNSNEEYGVAHNQARQKVDVALHAGLTSQDKVIALTLSMYLMSIETENESQKSSREMKIKWGSSRDERIQKMLLDDSRSSQVSQHVADFMSRDLHAALD